MGKIKAWAREHGMLDDGNEQQYQAEVMAEQEQDAEYLAWLDSMNQRQECEQ